MQCGSGYQLAGGRFEDGIGTTEDTSAGASCCVRAAESCAGWLCAVGGISLTARLPWNVGSGSAGSAISACHGSPSGAPRSGVAHQVPSTAGIPASGQVTTSLVRPLRMRPPSSIVSARMPEFSVSQALDLGHWTSKRTDRSRGAPNTFNLRLDGCSLGVWVVRDRRY